MWNVWLIKQNIFRHFVKSKTYCIAQSYSMSLQTDRWWIIPHQTFRQTSGELSLNKPSSLPTDRWWVIPQRAFRQIGGELSLKEPSDRLVEILSLSFQTDSWGVVSLLAFRQMGIESSLTANKFGLMYSQKRINQNLFPNFILYISKVIHDILSGTT